MRFWILLAAVIGYHVQDVWLYLLIWKHYHPGYPGMIVETIFSPGSFFFAPSLLVELMNAAVYGVIAYLVLLTSAKLRGTR